MICYSCNFRDLAYSAAVMVAFLIYAFSF